MLQEMVFIKFWLGFHTEKFKKLGEQAIHFDGAVLEIGTCLGMQGGYFSADFWKKNINTIQAYFLTFIIENWQF